MLVMVKEEVLHVATYVACKHLWIYTIQHFICAYGDIATRMQRIYFQMKFLVLWGTLQCLTLTAVSISYSQSIQAFLLATLTTLEFH